MSQHISRLPEVALSSSRRVKKGPGRRPQSGQASTVYGAAGFSRVHPAARRGWHPGPQQQLGAGIQDLSAQKPSDRAALIVWLCAKLVVAIRPRRSGSPICAAGIWRICKIADQLDGHLDGAVDDNTPRWLYRPFEAASLGGLTLSPSPASDRQKPRPVS